MGERANKGKVLVFERGGNHPSTITIGTSILECEPAFVYIGSLITKDNDYSVEISRRINLASQRLGMLKTVCSSSDLSINTKVDVLVSCVFFCLLHAAETWTVKAADSKKTPEIRDAMIKDNTEGVLERQSYQQNVS